MAVKAKATITLVKVDDGVKGDPGKGIESSSVTYQASLSGTTAPIGEWLDSIPNVAAGSYLWTRTIITYTDDTTTTSYSVGKMGRTGTSGKGIKSTSVDYQSGGTGTYVPTGAWSETVTKTSASAPYLWSRTIITYTDNTTSTTYSVGSTPEGIVVGGRNLYYTYDYDERDIDGVSSKTVLDGEFILIASGTNIDIGGRLGPFNAWSPLYGPLMDIEGASHISFSVTNPLFTNNFISFLDSDKIGLMNCGGVYSVSGTSSVPENAKYLTMCFGCNQAVPGTEYRLKIKVEKGNKITDWTPAQEDIDKNIISKVDEVKNDVDDVNSKIDGIEIGGRNLIKKSKFYAYRGITPVYGNDGWVAITGTLTEGTAVNIYNAREYTELNGSYTLSVERNPGETSSWQITLYNEEEYHSAYHISSDKTFVTFDATGLSLGYISLTNVAAGDTVDITARFKLEKGNKATAWTPNPEDIDDSINNAQASADVAQSGVDEVSDRVNRTEASISILEDSIENFVVGEDGETLVTQTSNGWVFSMADILKDIRLTSGEVGALNDSVGAINKDVLSLQNITDNLQRLNAYVRITTSGDQPCLELGNLGAFKVRITNTQIQFLQDNSVIAHVSNKELHIDKADVEDEIAFGEFALTRRSNGNVSFIWKG